MMEYLVRLAFSLGVLVIPGIAQTVDYTVDPLSVDCAGSWEASVGQGGSSGCSAWSNGEQVSNYWYGTAHMTIYGTCYTNHDEVSADNGVGWTNCALPPGGQMNGDIGYKQEFQDPYLVNIGYVDSHGVIWDDYGVQVYETHERTYCDGSGPVLIHGPYVPC